MKNDTLKGQYRINEQIRAKEVRIVGDDIEPKVYPIFQALKLAEEKELDLVEISPNAQPPVCRVIDYSASVFGISAFCAGAAGFATTGFFGASFFFGES